MSDASAPSSAEVKKPKMGCLLRGLVGCGVLVLLCPVVTGVIAFSKSRSATQRIERARIEVQAYKDAHPAERSTIATNPVPGNAASFYTATSWFDGPREEWGETPPEGMADPGLDRGAVDADERFSSSLMAGQLFAVAVRRPAGVPVDVEPSDAELALAEEFYATYASNYVALLREGTRRTSCDWGADLAKGAQMTYPNLVTLRTGLNLMLVAALRAPEPERLPRLLEALQLARDIARGPGLISFAMSTAVQATVFTALRAHLNSHRDPATRAALAEALTGELPSLKEAFTSEQLALDATLCHILGEPLVEMDPLEESEGADNWGGRAFVGHEWATVDRAWEQVIAALDLPPEQRRDACIATETEISESWTIIARVGFPNTSEALRMRDELEAHRNLLLVGIDALAVREETGAWPKSQAELPRAAERLDHSELPPQPFTFELDGDALVIRARGEGPVPAWRLEAKGD